MAVDYMQLMVNRFNETHADGDEIEYYSDGKWHAGEVSGKAGLFYGNPIVRIGNVGAWYPLPCIRCRSGI